MDHRAGRPRQVSLPPSQGKPHRSQPEPCGDPHPRQHTRNHRRLCARRRAGFAGEGAFRKLQLSNEVCAWSETPLRNGLEIARVSDFVLHQRGGSITTMLIDIWRVRRRVKVFLSAPAFAHPLAHPLAHPHAHPHAHPPACAPAASLPAPDPNLAASAVHERAPAPDRAPAC